MTEPLRRPALYPRHLDLGAKFAAFGGWEMPLEYAGGGVIRDHTAVREAVGVFDVSHLGKARVRGYLMLPRQHLEWLNPIERRVFQHKRLGLDPDKFTVFLATGGNGANNHLDLLPKLLPHADRAQAIVICGKNREAYNQLVHWRAELPAPPPGAYDLRCRSVDLNGIAQPLPRPFAKGGRSEIQMVPLQIEA